MPRTWKHVRGSFFAQMAQKMQHHAMRATALVAPNYDPALIEI